MTVTGKGGGMVPGAIDDEVLGRLVWEPALERWEGEIELPPGHEIHVSFTGAAAEAEEGLARARRAYEFIGPSQEHLRRAAARRLLDVYNDEWNEGDEIGEDGFIARMTLEAISFFASGDAEVFYDDGGLFRGHTVLVSIGSGGEITDADIAG